MFSPEEMKNKEMKFLKVLGQADVKKIEFDTRDQSTSEMWYNERKIRLTASRFGQICKMRSNTSCKNVVYNILYASDNLTTKSLQYGKEMETVARQKFEKISKQKVDDNGLIIDTEFPFLAATPGNIITILIPLTHFLYYSTYFTDGLIGEHSLLEIKCPYSARDTNDAIEAVNSKLVSVGLCLIIRV